MVSQSQQPLGVTDTTPSTDSEKDNDEILKTQKPEKEAPWRRCCLTGEVSEEKHEGAGSVSLQETAH